MFSPSVRSFLTVFTLSAITASAAPGLSLTLSGVDSVVDVANLGVSATLTNTGDETLKILNEPTSLLSLYATNSFGISSASGAAPAFNGIKVKYVPEQVAAKNSDSSFTVLAPGASVTIDHNLGDAYNFSRSGESAYTISPNALFTVVDESGALSIIKATTSTHTAKVSGQLSVAHGSNLRKRIDYNGCSSDEQATLVEAAAAAQTYAEESSSYLNSNTASTDRYVTWFGEFTDSRHSTVAKHYSNMLDHPYADYTYDCTCTDSDVYAYVYPEDFGTIYLCNVFWQTTTKGTDSRGGTLIHESSHFTIIGGTDDHVYGQSGAKSLAKSDPVSAIDNADSHEYFAENNPAEN